MGPERRWLEVGDDGHRGDPASEGVLGCPQVNEAEEERLRSEREHQRVTQLCQQAEAKVQALQKSLKRVIVKSKPYFELKAQFNQILEVLGGGHMALPLAVGHIRLVRGTGIPFWGGSCCFLPVFRMRWRGRRKGGWWGLPLILGRDIGMLRWPWWPMPSPTGAQG